jgi:hypothetical protein
MLLNCKEKNAKQTPQNVAINEQFVARNEQFVAQNEQFVARNEQFVAQNEQFVARDEQFVAQHCCARCSKNFATSSSLKRHEPICKEVCNNLQCPFCDEVLPSRSAKSRHVAKCKTQTLVLREKQDIVQAQPNASTINQSAQTINNTNNTNNVNNTQNITFNVNLNNLGNERLDHITPDMMNNFLKQINGVGVANLIDAIHFDPQVPENHNVRIDSIKGQTLLVYENNKWYIKDMSAILQFLVSNGCKMLYHHYDSSDEIKKEDREQHNGVILKNLHDINCKVPSVYQPTKRKIIASIRNFRMQKALDPPHAPSQVDVGPAAANDSDR